MSQNSIPFWNKTWSNTPDRFYPHFDYLVSLLPDKGKILDVGCGNGTLLKYIKEKKPDLELEGRDHSDVAMKNLRLRGIKCRVEKLPKITGEADIVIATEVLEHIKKDMAVLKAMRKITDQVIITVPNNRLGPNECNEHERLYTAESLEDKIKKYFDKYVISDVGGYLLVSTII